MKNIILIFLMIGCLIKIYSQDKKLEFNISLGATLSIPKTSELTDSKTDGGPEIKSSLNSGAFILPSANYSLNDKKSLDFGIGFYLDRFSMEEKAGPETKEGNRNISQIQTPINFNLHFCQDNSFQIGIGGFASFLISAKEKGESTINTTEFVSIDPDDTLIVDNNSTFIYDNDVMDNFNSISFGAFIKLEKSIYFSADKEGFILMKINQYFNSIKNAEKNPASSQYFKFRNEKEPTTLNLGIGLKI